MKLVAGVLCVLIAGTAFAKDQAPKGWKLVWSDEFNGPDGSAPDPAKWNVVTNSHPANAELEYYTDRPENVHLEKGNLVIVARKKEYTGKDGETRHYTSARLNTKGKFAQQYGRMEARMKIPKGLGMWPAFWMLGDNRDAQKWPDIGEIDTMENIGREPGKVHGSLHGPGYSGGSPLTGATKLPAGQAYGDAFHVYGVEWDAEAIRFYVDGVLYETQTPDSINDSKKWAFDHPFYLLLNLAVGGSWPHNPDETTVFPGTMLVDWVRVYSRK